jgi:hypothetical protein
MTTITVERVGDRALMPQRDFEQLVTLARQCADVAVRQGKQGSVSASPLSQETSGNGSAGTFWHEKSLEELAAEQGVGPIRQLEEVWGQGAHLWDSEADFQEFLAATKGA